MTPDELRAVLHAEGAKAVVPQHGVYELGVDQVRLKHLASRQSRVLSAIRQLPGRVFLHYDENPKDWELGEWSSPVERVWEVPSGHDTRALLSGFLDGGNWLLYVATQHLPSGAPTDAFKGDIPALVQSLQSCGVSAFVDAWHDNTEWRIVVGAGLGH